VDESTPGLGSRRHPRAKPIAAAIALLLALAAGVLAVDHWSEEEATAEPTSTSTTATTAPTTTAPATAVPASVDLATPNGPIPLYDRPNGTQIGHYQDWYGYTITSPIVQEGFGWAQIMMPQRPNETTAWVRTSDITRSSTDYRIVVERAKTHATGFKGGQPLFDFALGMGKSSTPTPLGRFFVAVVEHDLGHGYGPIVLDLSAHSEAIQSWQGAGDAIIAFHGPFGAQDLIRRGGGYVSNGCMRMLPEDQIKLDVIPVGTPVDIVEQL
jgi:lipoprotein-anchoring transpeptidase ErfK/SrfK